MMKRRNFLKIAGIGGALLALPITAFFAAKSVKDIAFDLITGELHYLKLDEEGVRQYVHDYLEMDRPDFLSKLKWKSYYLLNFDSNDSGNVRYLVSYYLLSSDFFLNKMDESKTVRYLGINQKYTSPCSSHFSFFLYPPKNAERLASAE